MSTLENTEQIEKRRQDLFNKIVMYMEDVYDMSEYYANPVDGTIQQGRAYRADAVENLYSHDEDDLEASLGGLILMQWNSEKELWEEY